MKSISTIASQLKSHVRTKFENVGCSLAATPERLVQEDAVVAEPLPLPCVLILVEGGTFTDGSLTRNLNVSFVLLDALKDSENARAVSMWEQCDALQELFPNGGTLIGDLFCVPLSFRTLSGPEGRAACSLSVLVRETDSELI